MPAIWLNLLRDLSPRLALPPAVEREIKELLARPEDDRRLAADAARVGEQLVIWVDEQLVKTTEERFALGDASTVRQRLLADPRRQVDQTVASFKQRFQAERAEWTRRITKQQADVQDSTEKELRTIALQTKVEGSRGESFVDEAWLLKYSRWLDDVLTTWAEHVADLLPAKLSQAIEADMRVLTSQLGEAPSLWPQPPTPLAVSSGKLELPELRDPMEVPTTLEAFTEIFKSAMGTVLMLVGVAATAGVAIFSGGDMREQGHLRAIGLAALVVPVIVYAVFQTRVHRKRLLQRNTEKALEKMKKALELYTKTRVDRFAKEIDRYVGSWLQQAQGEVGQSIDATIASAFARREASVASELAKAQLNADKLQDQIQMLKQARSSLMNNFLVEARRRLAQ